MPSAKMSPEQKYTQETGRVYVSGNQALVRLPVEQSRRDRLAGLNTGGFISGYRGSPLGHLDQDLWRVRKLLESKNIRFQPGVNEDMAATAIWGSQQTGFFQSDVDGVFGLWYGKGPGIDRSGDALRHANLWGTSKHGGVIMAVGDDPMSRSSSIQQQSELTLMSECIPVFNAANVQDIYDFGLIGWQLSRYAGVWVGIKAVSDTYESWYDVDVSEARTRIVLPTDHVVGAPGAHIRWPDRSVDQDERMLTVRLPAVRAFARANQLNRVTHGGGGKRRLGIITTGKSYVDTLEALADLGIDARQLEDIGLSIYKVGLVWPLEGEGITAFAQGLDEVFIIEECRPVLEPQVKDILYHLPEGQRPRILGKRDREGQEQFNSHGELTPVVIARALVAWLKPVHETESMRAWIRFLDQTDQKLNQPRQLAVRTPYFCSGCPHNTSTKVPEGSVQLAGIGCHWLATLMERKTVSYPQMGGEGATWVGAFPFVKDEHTFVNVGDGTYYHSGSMAIRQAIAGKVNITYKILYNDAVAMTGGQPVDGPISVGQISYEMYGEGVRNIAVVSANPEGIDRSTLAPGVHVYHRDELDTVQKRYRLTPGVSIIIYEQTCATELRRRRGRKLAADPQRRVFINDRVCEGCGDCGVQSNCLSVQPLETEFGRKRVIDQSACNKDFSCLKGFCPSFVTIEGGSLRKGKGVSVDESLFASLPEPAVASTADTVGVMVTGIGGTGVVTIANLIGSAAQTEGKYAQALDLTGMAQKFGAVFCHLKIADRIEDLNATRLSIGKAKVLLGADVVVAASNESLSRLREGVTHAVVNDHETVTGAFTRDVNFHIPLEESRQAIRAFCGEGRADFHDTTELSRLLTGDTIGANMMLLGYACQKGWLPVRHDSLEKAIEENGVAVPYNLRIFKLGRLLAHDAASVKRMAEEAHVVVGSRVISESLAQMVERREKDLVAYQDAAYGKRYRTVVEAAVAAENRLVRVGFAEAVARNLYKVMAIKDEYEIARLYTDGEFLKSIQDQFDGDYELRFHFSPPLLSDIDKNTGRPKKSEYGPGTLKWLAWLAGKKHWRGSALDLFGRTAERREERQLRDDYESAMLKLSASLSHENYKEALALAKVPEEIRGYGPVRQASQEKVAGLLDMLRQIARRP